MECMAETRLEISIQFWKGKIPMLRDCVPKSYHPVLTFSLFPSFYRPGLGETTGLDFSPDRKAMYISFQRK